MFELNRLDCLHSGITIGNIDRRGIPTACGEKDYNSNRKHLACSFGGNEIEQAEINYGAKVI